MNKNNNDLISVGVNTYVVFCDNLQVWKQVWILEARSENGCDKWPFSGLKQGRDSENRAAPTPPPPKNS